ncbi:MAG: YafY family transcriptional regulator [Spirochaetales bacterium]|nr:YafY family transcriptional regulator [Spirochaetales bacterium]
MTASELSTKFGVSIRTVYRDIASLQRQGVPIEGEAGVGYVLRRGYTLPPLAFTGDEIDALVLGLRWVTANGDTTLAAASQSALGKVSATVPHTVEDVARAAGLVLQHRPQADCDDTFLRYLRSAIRKERKIHIRYRNAAGTPSDRTIWPVALGYFKKTHLVAAWCELRSDFRHFRTDRVAQWSPCRAPIPTPHTELFERWRRRENLSRNQTGV